MRFFLLIVLLLRLAFLPWVLRTLRAASLSLLAGIKRTSADGDKDCKPWYPVTRICTLPPTTRTLFDAAVLLLLVALRVVARRLLLLGMDGKETARLARSLLEKLTKGLRILEW